MKEKILLDQLQYADEMYAKGTPVMSDREYDILRAKFRNTFPNNPYNKVVGASVEGEKVKLPFTLGSLNKVKPDGSYQDFQNKYTGEKVYWAKLDGVSVLVQYIDGVYYRSLTRGDGEYGQDVTEKLMSAVPMELNENVTGSYRAEVLLTEDAHIVLGYKTRRNGVAGILNRDDQSETGFLKVKFYEVVEDLDWDLKDNTEVDRIKRMEELGFDLAPYVVGNNKSDEELVEILRNWKTENPFDIDGIVVVLNESEREDTYYPDLKVAFKVNEESVICDVVGLTWKVGRTGRVVPVVNIKPTEIGGVTVSNATGFNYEFIVDNGVGAGSKVGIYRSGDVIPYIDFVEDGVKLDGELMCPSCFNPTVRKGVDMVCENESCPDQLLLKTEYFLTTLGCENVTTVTLKKIGVNSIYDAYELDEFEITELDGFGIKRAEQIMFEINKTLKTNPAKLLAAFGVAGIGESNAQGILKVYDFDQLWDLDEFQLTKVSGIGKVLAKNFVDQIGEFKEVYEYMKDKGLTWNTETNSLRGKVFCLTGTAPIKRDNIVKMIESNGGYVKGMSKKVDVLVTNDINSQSGKAKKAREYGTQIISYDDLMEEIG